MRAGARAPLEFFVTRAILTLLFVVGAWSGDLFERSFTPGRRAV